MICYLDFHVWKLIFIESMSKRKSEKSFPYKNKDGKLQLNTNNDIV